MPPDWWWGVLGNALGSVLGAVLLVLLIEVVVRIARLLHRSNEAVEVTGRIIAVAVTVGAMALVISRPSGSSLLLGIVGGIALLTLVIYVLSTGSLVAYVLARLDSDTARPNGDEDRSD